MSRRRNPARSTAPAAPPPEPAAPPPDPAVRMFDEKHYPHFPDSTTMANYKQLKLKKTCKPTLLPCLRTLTDFGLMDKVRPLFEHSGLGILFSRQRKTIIPAMYEFVASFRPHGPPGQTTHWSFRLQDIDFTLDRGDVCRVLEFHLEGIVPHFSATDKDDFWKYISELDVEYLSTHPATAIKLPEWKVAHRLVAMAVNVRKEGGTVVNERDIDILIAMSRDLRVDYFEILTARFQEWASLEGRKPNLAISGGLYITLLAESLGFDFSTSYHSDIWKLTVPRMVKSQMLTRDQQWDHRPDIPESGVKGQRLEGKRRRMGRSQGPAPFPEPDFDPFEAQEPPGPSTSQPPPAQPAPRPPTEDQLPSTFMERLERLETSQL